MNKFLVFKVLKSGTPQIISRLYHMIWVVLLVHFFICFLGPKFIPRMNQEQMAES